MSGGKLTAKQAAQKAAEAYANLNVFAAVEGMMGGGLLSPSYNAAADRIIKICQAEMQRQVRAYDAALAAIQKEGGER